MILTYVHLIQRRPMLGRTENDAMRILKEKTAMLKLLWWKIFGDDFDVDFVLPCEADSIVNSIFRSYVYRNETEQRVIADPYNRFRPPFAEAVIPNDRTLPETPPSPDWRTPYADGRQSLPVGDSGSLFSVRPSASIPRHRGYYVSKPRERGVPSRVSGSPEVSRVIQYLSYASDRDTTGPTRERYINPNPEELLGVANVPRGVPRHLQAPFLSGARATLEPTRAPYRFNGQPTSPPRLREFPFAGSPEARRAQKRRAFPMHNSGSPEYNRLTAPPNGRMNRFTVPVSPEPTRGAGNRRTRLPTEPTRRGSTLSRNNLDTVMASPRRRGQAWYRLPLTRPSSGNIAPYQTFHTDVSSFDDK
ncbi:hypothetical protein MAR_002985 [Mya arenaria]|uniref:Uncharacterized protein n=1 Tax=Mya arenaria TaxID=6604 RepID=A0ABY7G650_MYAAR|nr:hypothetical protein MAR_002985 [Mya arenaria]